MAEVVRLELAPRPVNSDALAVVEEVLARVRAGEVTAVAIVEVNPAGRVSTHWSGSDHYHQLNSGCARLAHRIAAAED